MPQIQIEVRYYADPDNDPYRGVAIGEAKIRVPELDDNQQAHLAAKIAVDAHASIVRLSAHLEATGIISDIKAATQELAAASKTLPEPDLADGDHFAGEIGTGNSGATEAELDAEQRHAEAQLEPAVSPVSPV